MCHISHHHRYGRDSWSLCGWSWFDDVEPADEAEPVERRDEPAPVSAAGSRDPDLRVSQAERDDVAAALARHFADGRLTVEEYEERVEAALAARTGRDLEPLLADLPAPAAPARARRPRADRRAPRTPALPSARVLAVAAVVVLAITTGWWALWLLWPALILTGSCASRSRYRYGDPRTTRSAPPVRDPAVTRL